MQRSQRSRNTGYCDMESLGHVRVDEPRDVARSRTRDRFPRPRRIHSARLCHRAAGQVPHWGALHAHIRMGRGVGEDVRWRHVPDLLPAPQHVAVSFDISLSNH